MPPVIRRDNAVNGTPKPPPRRAGGILGRAVPVAQLPAGWVKMLVYGQNRTGKTCFACTFPKPLLLVSFEPNETGGAQSVKRVPGVEFLRLTKRDEAVQLAAQLAEGLVEQPGMFATVVLDTVTSLQDVVLQDILGLDQLPAQLNFGAVSGDQYRARSELTKETLRPFAALPCHTVFLAKEKDHNPPKEEKVNERTGKVQPDMRPRFLRGMQIESWISADLGAGTAGWVQDVCDYVCRLYFDREVVVEELKAAGRTIKQAKETGKFVRALRTMYHPNFAAGFRSERPETIPESIEEPTWEKVEKLIRG